MDTVAGTLCLPPHRIDRLYALLDAFPPTRKRVPASAWHRLLGENHSMTPALPGARGLFSILQDTLRQRSNNRLRLTRQVFDCLADFRLIADSLRNRPTRLRELVPVGAPYALGACDACLRGMGGVWFLPHQGPVVWRAAFPPAIQRALATSANRLGTLSISDLELAGTLAHKHALVQLDPTSVAERIIWLAGDNRASLSWATKGSATARSARACLLRLNALPQRCYRYVPHHDFIAGKSNVMADDASHLLEVAPPGTRHALSRDWCAVEATIRASHSAHRVTAAASTSGVWVRFCLANGICPDLRDLSSDPILVLLLFAHQYRTGRIAPRDRPVRSRTVEEAVRQVAQAFSRVGSVDPRLNSFGDLDFRLQALFRAWKKADPPPARVKPVPLSVVRRAYAFSLSQPPALRLAATGDCLLLAYYFLLRPGEYTGCPKTVADDLFCIQDVGLSVGRRRLDPLRCPPPELLAASFGTVTFTSQKNGVRGETIGHGRSGHPTLCPVHALVRRIRQLRLDGATPTTPLNACYKLPSGTWQYVLPADVTALLRHGVALLPHTDLDAQDFTARCTRAGGAMALLCGGIGADRIRYRALAVGRNLPIPPRPSSASDGRRRRHDASRRRFPPQLPTLPHRRRRWPTLLRSSGQSGQRGAIPRPRVRGGTLEG